MKKEKDISEIQDSLYTLSEMIVKSCLTNYDLYMWAKENGESEPIRHLISREYNGLEKCKWKCMYSGRITEYAIDDIECGITLSSLSKDHDYGRTAAIQDLLDDLIPMFDKDKNILIQVFYMLLVETYCKWSYVSKKHKENTKKGIQSKLIEKTYTELLNRK